MFGGAGSLVDAKHRDCKDEQHRFACIRFVLAIDEKTILGMIPNDGGITMTIYLNISDYM